MLEWYKDDEIGIFFSKKPHIDVRYITSDTDEKLKKEIKNKPFENKSDINVSLVDYKNSVTYNFNIPKGYTWDGSSIPRFFWRLIGSNSDNCFLIGSLVHDTLCENKDYVNYDRKFSSKVFKALCIAGGTGKFKAHIMYLAVDNFQKFKHW